MFYAFWDRAGTVLGIAWVAGVVMIPAGLLLALFISPSWPGIMLASLSPAAWIIWRVVPTPIWDRMEEEDERRMRGG